MIDFEELFDEFLDYKDDGRFSVQGGYPSQRIFYDDKVFVATVDHDGGPELDVYDMQEFREFIVTLIEIFCQEKGLSSFEEIKKHEEYGDFFQSLAEGVYQLDTERLTS